MLRNQEKVSASGIIILILVMLNVIILKTAFIHDAQIYWGLIISLPLLFIAIFDAIKNKRAIRSEFRQLKRPLMIGRKINKTHFFQRYLLLKLLSVKTSHSKSRVGDGFTVETQREGAKNPQD